MPDVVPHRPYTHPHPHRHHGRAHAIAQKHGVHPAIAQNQGVSSPTIVIDPLAAVDEAPATDNIGQQPPITDSDIAALGTAADPALTAEAGGPLIDPLAAPETAPPPTSADPNADDTDPAVDAT